MSQNKFYFAVFIGLFAILPTTIAFSTDITSDYNNYANQTSYDSVHDWSGNYVGVESGASSSDFPNPFSDRSGALIGVVVGKNLQNKQFVYGGEFEGFFSATEHPFGRDDVLQQSWSAIAKARVGITTSKTFVYGTIGYGTSRFTLKDSFTSEGQWKGGALFGIGIEQSISDTFSIKGEYDYMRFSDVKIEFASTTTPRNNLYNHALKIGLNYKF